MFVIKTRVGPSPIHGIGVFACEDVAAGGPVWRFHPPFDQILSEQEIANLPDAAREYLEIYAYTSSDLGGQLVLSGDHARFLNPSDDPNPGHFCRSHAGQSLRAMKSPVTTAHSAWGGWAFTTNLQRASLRLIDYEKCIPSPQSVHSAEVVRPRCGRVRNSQHSGRDARVQGQLRSDRARAARHRGSDSGCGIASYVFRFLPERGRCIYRTSRFQSAHDGMVFESFGQSERHS